MRPTVLDLNLTRRQLMALGLVGLAEWCLLSAPSAHAALQDDWEQVSLIPEIGGRDGPLLIFRDFEADPDVEVMRHLRHQLGQRKDLLDQVQKKIGPVKKVRLSIEALEVRLMFVPQSDARHAVAYHRFCQGITNYFFEMVQEDNFYTAISSPRQNHPLITETGISAFLVHRLAKRYQAVCRFTDESGRRVSYRVSGAIFSNHVGAVDLEIQMLDQGQFGLSRKPFTIWQNDADNLYTLLSVPVEETLHYYLGRATDREIAVWFRNEPPDSLHTAWEVAEAWMAVEEAVVGGLVNEVIARYCRDHQLAMPASAWNGLPPAATALPQYRHRDQGLRLVERLGFREVMAMYRQSPSDFRTQLLQQHT